MAGDRLRKLISLACGLALGSVLCSSPAFAGSSLYWSYPTVIDTAVIDDLSCPSASFCAGVDRSGKVLTSTNPTGGAGAWSVTQVDKATPEPPPYSTAMLDGVSCPTPAGSLCVAVGEHGIFTSTNPSGGSAWAPVNGVGLHSRAVSCPSVSLCVVAGAAYYGEIITSTEPSGGPGAWNAVKVGGSSPIVALSCPTVALCVGVDLAGDVLTSTNPTSGAEAWKITPVGGLSDVSCPSASFCAAVGGSRVMTSTNPTGDASAWTVQVETTPGSNDFHQVACASPSRCVVSESNGDIAESANPMGGAAAWGGADGVDGTNSLLAATCASESLCFVTDEALLIGTPAHRLSVSLQGEGSVASGPLVCPFGCTYNGPTCPRNCIGPVSAFIPQRLGGITCIENGWFGAANWGTCSFSFPAEDTVTLSATPERGWVFAGWGGACSGGVGCNLPMAADRAVTATFALPPAPSPMVRRVPVLTGLRQTHQRWREGSAPARISAKSKGLPVGTDFLFTLDASAKVNLSFTQRVQGARVGRKCVAHRRSKRHRCRRSVIAGVLRFSAHAGSNDVRFDGVISRHRRLKPGTYTLVIRASAAGSSPPGRLRFTIVR